MTAPDSRRDAVAAFKAGDFESAYRAYIGLWYRDERLDDLVWATRSLERAQQWRANIAMWEEVARTISDKPPDPGRKGGDRLFDGLQKRDEYWRQPPGAKHPDYYDRHKEKADRHRRAWALHWAAEEASAAERHELAARLHRAAAFAWTTTSWGDKDTSEWGLCSQCSPRPKAASRSSPSGCMHDDAGCNSCESQAHPDDAPERGLVATSSASKGVAPDPRGEKWELAACSYFYSVMEGIESKLRDRKDPLDEEYALSDSTGLRGFSAGTKEVPPWLKRDELNHDGLRDQLARAWSSLSRVIMGEHKQDTDLDEGRLSDIDRLVLCYRKWAEVRSGGTRPNPYKKKPDDAMRVALKHAHDALGAIEGAFTRVGRRTDAKRVHLTRRKLQRDRERGRLTIVWPFTKWIFGDGARNWVPFAWVVSLWLVVFPAVFTCFDLVHNGRTAEPASSADSYVFSIANALTISVGALHTRGFWGGLAQAGDTALLYILFGLALYTLTRSFEE